jgi:hypothetical protein
MIIFDLDGTLANCEHRRHFVDPEKNFSLYFLPPGNTKNNMPSGWYTSNHERWKPDWKAFYEACDKDDPIEPVINLFHDLNGMEREVNIWSGRCESTREKTYQWLLDHVEIKYITRFCPEKHLKMRPIGDYTPDDQLKERWLDEALAEGKKIEFVFDDRKKVVRMWRRRGIFVFNCCQHDEEF